MITAVLASAVLVQQKTICPLMTKRPTTGVMSADYGGRRIFVCCDVCLTNIKKGTDKIIERSIKGNLLIGEFLYEPITQKRIVGRKAEFQSSYKGFKVYFETEANQQLFDAEPEKYWKHPTRESRACPISGAEIKDLATAAGFKDVNGVRYYACSPDCFDKLQTSEEVVKNVSNSITNVVARPLPFPGGG